MSPSVGRTSNYTIWHVLRFYHNNLNGSETKLGWEQFPIQQRLNGAGYFFGNFTKTAALFIHTNTLTDFSSTFATISLQYIFPFLFSYYAT